MVLFNIYWKTLDKDNGFFIITLMKMIFMSSLEGMPSQRMSDWNSLTVHGQPMFHNLVNIKMLSVPGFQRSWSSCFSLESFFNWTFSIEECAFSPTCPALLPSPHYVRESRHMDTQAVWMAPLIKSSSCCWPVCGQQDSILAVCTAGLGCHSSPMAG